MTARVPCSQPYVNNCPRFAAVSSLGPKRPPKRKRASSSASHSTPMVASRPPTPTLAARRSTYGQRSHASAKPPDEELFLRLRASARRSLSTHCGRGSRAELHNRASSPRQGVCASAAGLKQKNSETHASPHASPGVCLADSLRGRTLRFVTRRGPSTLPSWRRPRSHRLPMGVERSERFEELYFSKALRS